MHIRDHQVLLVTRDPRETEERRALLVLKAPMVLQANQDKLELTVLLDLQEKQVLQLR